MAAGWGDVLGCSDRGVFVHRPATIMETTVDDGCLLQGESCVQPESNDAQTPFLPPSLSNFLNRLNLPACIQPSDAQDPAPFPLSPQLLPPTCA